MNDTPHNDQVEHSLIGCLLSVPDHINGILDKIKPEHFWNPGLLLFWQQIRSDYIARRDIDFILVTGRLIESGLKDKVNAAISGLCEYLTPSPLSVCVEHVKLLESMRLLREAFDATRPINSAIQSQNLVEVKQGAEALLRRLSGEDIASGHALHEIFLEVLDEQGEPSTMGIKTGLDWLDSKTGGFSPGSLEIVAAPRGGGKSAIALQRVWNASSAGHFVSFFSIEMTRREVFQRICCLEGVRSDSFMHRRYSQGELAIIQRVGAMKTAPFRIYDDLYRIEDIAARIRLDVARFNMRIAVVDYVQLVKGEKGEGREREVSGVALELKSLALSLGITIIAPSQLNSDLQARESRDIENHCDKMILIARSQKPDEEDNGRRLVKITKNRNGQSDCRCLYQFTGENFRFAEVEETTADIEPAKPSYRHQ